MSFAELRLKVLRDHYKSYCEFSDSGPICIRGPLNELVDLKPSGIRAVRLLAAEGLMSIHQTIVGTFADIVRLK